ncbi:hypothetical protein SEA_THREERNGTARJAY_80 [Mycobacterium phage ThreeRngTarjay]|nr:hypothetical protein SEA_THREERNGTARJAY_80 [Mycobacterium phage ThreeRngTarjay]
MVTVASGRAPWCIRPAYDARVLRSVAGARAERWARASKLFAGVTEAPRRLEHSFEGYSPRAGLKVRLRSIRGAGNRHPRLEGRAARRPRSTCKRLDRKTMFPDLWFSSQPQAQPDPTPEQPLDGRRQAATEVPPPPHVDRDETPVTGNICGFFPFRKGFL